MISITCDKCDRALSVEESLAGSKIACPHCGDINVVPRVSTAPVAGTGNSSQATPHQQSPSKHGPGGPPPLAALSELHVAFVRPAPFRAHPFRAGGLLVLSLAGIAGLVYFGMIEPQRIWAWVSGGVLVLALVALGTWKVLSLAEVMEVTTKRSILRRGLLSKATSEVRHEDIRNFQITQSFMERVLGVGTIGISSAGQDEVEIVMKDVPAPAKLRAVIDKHRTL